MAEDDPAGVEKQTLPTENNQKFTCFDIYPGSGLDIRPSPRQRQWMTDSLGSSAYRCLPLVVANQHGWEIRSHTSFEAVWDGGKAVDATVVHLDDPSIKGAKSHFGSGIVTFEIPSILRLPPGYNLWVMPPVNRFKDAIQGLSALIESDWIPFTFTVNWKFTRPDTPVRFEKGDPIAMIFPVPRGILGSLEPTREMLDNEPDLRRQFKTGVLRRQTWEMRLATTGENDPNLKHQGWYTRGTLPDETSQFPDHQINLNLKPFPASTDDDGET